MVWFPLSLLSALSLATADALTKRFFGNLSPYEMGTIRLTYTMPWLICAFFWIPLVKPDNTFFLSVAVGLPLEILALYFYMKAIKVSPLSLTLPFLAFTPVFIILTGRLILGEELHLYGVLGIFLIVAGSYCLNLSHIRSGFLAPLKAIIKEPGSRMMLMVSFIYSLTSVIGKLGILHSNPYFFAVTYFTALTILMLAFAPFVQKSTDWGLLRFPLKGLLLGFTQGLMIFTHVLAISQVQAAYMISIKRTSLLFAVLYGAWWFKEEKIGERFLGTVIMIGGVLLVGFFA
jgi:drug/metabolite transporter (DMT)-like permease